VLTTGVDIIEIERVQHTLRRWGDHFMTRVFTSAEIGSCHGRAHELAVRFAGKEAISKALGTGIWCRDGVWWSDMEILPDALGKPVVHLYGRARQRADALGLTEIAISLSHSDHYAVAFVVAQ
jgi:holo-[acyl-carrier protein] synthase